MNLRDLQREHLDWERCCHPPFEAWHAALGVAEEFGELAHAFLHQSAGTRGNQVEKMRDAVGDVVVYLASFCNKMGIDLAGAVDSAWGEVRGRDWVRFPRDGRTK